MADVASGVSVAGAAEFAATSAVEVAITGVATCGSDAGVTVASAAVGNDAGALSVGNVRVSAGVAIHPGVASGIAGAVAVCCGAGIEVGVVLGVLPQPNVHNRPIEKMANARLKHTSLKTLLMLVPRR